MKFLITAKHADTEYNGGAIVFMTGKPPFINVNDSLIGRVIGEDKVLFKTGLEEGDIDRNDDLKDEEVAIYKEKAKVLIEKIKKRYKDATDPTNRIFWDDQRTTLKITSGNISNIYDTDEVDHAILYLNIVAGGFPSVAPSKEVADRTGQTFYMTTQEEDVKRQTEEVHGNKMEAMLELGSLLTEAGNDALVYISYLLTDLNKGYTKNTDRGTLKKDMLDYIENGVNGKDKKKSADNFYKLAKTWQVDKETVIGKSIVSAAMHYGRIKKNKDTKKYEYKGINLGTTVQSAYDILNKSSNQPDFEELTDEIEKILNK